MAVEYLGLSSLNGPLAVLEGVSGAAYDEIVEMTVDGKEKKLGRIIEAYEDKAVIQVFESTGNMALKNTHTRLTGHPMEIGVSADMLGRTFDGLGNPIDGLGPILADKKLDVNGKPLNPVAREYPRNFRHRWTDDPDPRSEASDLLRKRTSTRSASRADRHAVFPR